VQFRVPDGVTGRVLVKVSVGGSDSNLVGVIVE
jgi:hypothetical protein